MFQEALKGPKYADIVIMVLGRYLVLEYLDPPRGLQGCLLEGPLKRNEDMIV